MKNKAINKKKKKGKLVITMTAKRTQLKPKFFEKLLFLRKNHKIIGNIFPQEIYNEINET